MADTTCVTPYALIAPPFRLSARLPRNRPGTISSAPQSRVVCDCSSSVVTTRACTYMVYSTGLWVKYCSLNDNNEGRK